MILKHNVGCTPWIVHASFLNNRNDVFIIAFYSRFYLKKRNCRKWTKPRQLKNVANTGNALLKIIKQTFWSLSKFEKFVT